MQSSNFQAKFKARNLVKTAILRSIRHKQSIQNQIVSPNHLRTILFINSVCLQFFKKNKTLPIISLIWRDIKISVSQVLLLWL